MLQRVYSKIGAMISAPKMQKRPLPSQDRFWMDPFGQNRKESEYEKKDTFISARLEITEAGLGINFVDSENPQRAGLVRDP